MVARAGSSATISREPRQARKGATVTVISGAGGVPVRAASFAGAGRQQPALVQWAATEFRLSPATAIAHVGNL